MKKKKKEDGPLTREAKKNAQGPLETKKIKRRKSKAPAGKTAILKKQNLENVKSRVKDTIEQDKATEDQWSKVDIEEQKLLQSMGLASLEIMEDDQSWSIVREECRGKRRIEDSPVKEEKEIKRKKKSKKTLPDKENVKTHLVKSCKLEKATKPLAQQSKPPAQQTTASKPSQPVTDLSHDRASQDILTQDMDMAVEVIVKDMDSSEQTLNKTTSTELHNQNNRTLEQTIQTKSEPKTASNNKTDKKFPVKSKILPQPTPQPVSSDAGSNKVSNTDAKPGAYAILVAERKARKKLLRKEKIKNKKILVENKPILSDEVREKKRAKRKERIARAKLRKQAEKEAETMAKKQVGEHVDQVKGEKPVGEQQCVVGIDVHKEELEQAVVDVHKEEVEGPEAVENFIKEMRAMSAVNEDSVKDDNEKQVTAEISVEEETAEDSVIEEETAEDSEEETAEEFVDGDIEEAAEGGDVEDERVEAMLAGLTEASTAEIDLTDEEKAKGKIWIEMGVCDALVKGLVELGFTSPTPIQSQCIPAGLLTYKDVIGAAETGSGKTLAFGIPLLHRVLLLAKGEGVRGLVMAPTRELALQVTDHLKKAAKYTGVSIVPIVGGIAHPKQMRLLAHKPEIIVATPGRYWQLVQEHEYLQNTSALRFLVIDEADRMVEDGHFVELTDIVTRLPGPTVRNTFLFSATLTFAIEHMGTRANKKNKKKSKAERKQSKKDAGLEMLVRNIGIRDKREVVDFTLSKGTAQSLTETYLLCDVTDKDLFLYYLLLNHPGRTLVFCNSIDGVMNLVHIMHLLQLPVHPLHSALQQRQRFKFLDRFKERDTCALIATDVAARGLDIAAVDTVIHYQLPATREAYIHRSGRTARAENSGLSIALVGPKDFKSYRKVSSNMSEFPMENARLRELRPALKIARDIFRIERLHTRPDQADAKLEALAADAGLDTKLDKSLSAPGATTKKEVKVLKAQLKQTLARPIVDPVNNQRYLTTQDSFHTLSTFSIGRKALEHNSEKKKKKGEDERITEGEVKEEGGDDKLD